jgi:hypothetical protein
MGLHLQSFLSTVEWVNLELHRWNMPIRLYLQFLIVIYVISMACVTAVLTFFLGVILSQYKFYSNI